MKRLWDFYNRCIVDIALYSFILCHYVNTFIIYNLFCSNFKAVVFFLKVASGRKYYIGAYHLVATTYIFRMKKNAKNAQGVLGDAIRFAPPTPREKQLSTNI
jgi:hypothetical protein